MKVCQCAASMALPLFCLLAAEHLSTAEAARESMAVEADGIIFSVERYDDGRSKPYRVSFTEDGVESTYRFNTAGFVTNIVVGSEKYRVRYESNGDLSEVRRTPSGRRGLLVGVEGQNEVAGAGLLVGGDGQGVKLVDETHRRLYACDDCVEAWDAVCDDGVPSLCDLVDYGHPIKSAAEASIATMCNVMGGVACSSSGGAEACLGQCEGDDDGTDVKVLNSCLDITSDNYVCSFDGSTTINLTSCAFVDADAEDLPECFESFGKDNIERLWLSFHEDLTTLPVGIFSGLSSVVDMDLSYNGLERLPVGAFSGLTGVLKLEIHYSKLESLPEGIFSELTNLEHLVVSSSLLTSLPAEIFTPLTNLQTLDLRITPTLQCVPASSATTVLVTSDDILQGTCECEPAVAIACETGSCQPGGSGYTCE